MGNTGKKWQDMGPDEQLVAIVDWRTRDAMATATSAFDGFARMMADSPTGDAVIRWLKHEFTAAAMEPVNLLPGLGIRFGWQYAMLTYGDLERLIPDRKTRGAIIATLAPMGLLPDTQFAERHLRFLTDEEEACRAVEHAPKPHNS